MARFSIAALVALAILPLATAELKNDFSLYPKDARPCLIEAADDSGCSGNTAVEMNGCLCRNTGNFVFPAARCIGREAPQEVVPVYDQLVSNCKDSATQLTVSSNEFFEAAVEGASETSGPSQTETGSQTTETNSNDNNDDDGENTTNSGLTTAEIAGISVVGAVVLASLAAGIFVLIRRRRARKALREESHPMLDQSPGGGSAVAMTGPTPTTPYATSPNTISELPTAEMGAVGANTLSPAVAAWPAKTDKSACSPGSTPSPSGQWTPSTQHASWVSPPPGYSYTAQHGGHVHEMPHTPAQAHDAASAAAAATTAAPAAFEMDASQPYHGPPSAPGPEWGR